MEEKKLIFIASDHAGYEMKTELIPFLESLNYEVKDFGAFKFDKEDDYPDFVMPLAKEISDNPDSKGIILGGSGQGEAICANRFHGVRAAVFYGNTNTAQVDIDFNILEMITSERIHNDSNVLSLGARFLSLDDAKKAVKLWLETDFSGVARHLRRIKKIEDASC